jgi:hypothetical protein
MMKERKKRISNIEYRMSNVEGWCAEGAVSLLYSVFLVLHSIFPPNAALFPGEVLHKA